MEELREYKAIVWVGESAGQRVTLRAKNLKDAKAQINEQYGEGPDVVTSIWNEEDAKKTTLNIPKNVPYWECFRVLEFSGWHKAREKARAEKPRQCP